MSSSSSPQQPSGGAVGSWLLIALYGCEASAVFALLAIAGGEAVVRAFSVSELTGTRFGNTLLLPRDWEDVKVRHRELLALVRDDLSYFVVDDRLGWVPGPGELRLLMPRLESPSQTLSAPSITASSSTTLESRRMGASFYDASYAIRFLRSRFRPLPALDSYPPAAPITLRLEMPRLPAVFCQLSAMPWPGTDCYC